MNRKLFAVGILAFLATTGIGLAFAEEHEPEIVFSEFQFAVIGIGAFAGLVTAYNGYVKAKREQKDAFKFDRTRFLDRVFMAVLAAIPLAVAESANVVKLDLFGAWIIFAASLGTAELIMELRGRGSK